MKLLARLLKQIRFWVILALSLLITYCLTSTLIWYRDYYRTTMWENLPRLPNGEMAQEITEVYVHREVHVRTDQGHYYGSRYQKKGTSWFPIPREINHLESGLPWLLGMEYPPPPQDARQVAVYRIGHRYQSGTFAAIIRADGQVAYWDGIGADQLGPYGWEVCSGMIFLFLGVSITALIISWRRMLREPPLPDAQEISQPH